MCANGDSMAQCYRADGSTQAQWMEGNAGVLACESTRRPASCRFGRRDAARTRSRDGRATQRSEAKLTPTARAISASACELFGYSFRLERILASSFAPMPLTRTSSSSERKGRSLTMTLATFSGMPLMLLRSSTLALLTET